MFLLTNARHILAALLFYSGTTLAACPSATGSSSTGLSLVPLQQGVNTLALAHPTSADFAVLATFKNNTSYPNRDLSFCIKTPDGYSLLPLPNSDASPLSGLIIALPYRGRRFSIFSWCATRKDCV